MEGTKGGSMEDRPTHTEEGKDGKPKGTTKGGFSFLNPFVWHRLNFSGFCYFIILLCSSFSFLLLFIYFSKKDRLIDNDLPSPKKYSLTRLGSNSRVKAYSYPLFQSLPVLVCLINFF